MIVTKLLTLPAAVLGLSLSACSGEPSESEMLQVLNRFAFNIQQQQAAEMAFVVGTERGGMPAMPTVSASASWAASLSRSVPVICVSSPPLSAGKARRGIAPASPGPPMAHW